MYNFSINFQHPWLLMLLIPAAALTVMNYFMVYKRYRNTRNRIVSLVAHSLCMILAIAVLAGTTFEYDKKNDSNEMIILVDMSDTQPDESDARDAYLRELLNEAQYSNVKVGLVTFGFSQVYAAPMTFDTESVYEQFKSAQMPDVGATDIAAAIDYAAAQFQHPDTAKILILSDGIETDESALAAVRSAALDGVKVDVTQMDPIYADDGVQVSAITTPDYYVRVNEECTVYVDINSKQKLEGVNVDLFINGDSVATQDGTTISEGDQTLTFSGVTFGREGLHELKATLSYEGEKNGEVNNAYCAYYYIQIHDNILILEQKNGQSAELERIIKEEYGKDVTVTNVLSAGEMPTSVEELCSYDQVVLNNVSNSDLGDEFVNLLYSYVHDMGGSVFTVGGMDDESGEAHAYNREDLFDSKLQEMLPVDAVNYKPPMGVVLIVDDSGSMTQYLPAARAGALGCLEVLDDRDFVAVMTFSNNYTYEIPLLSCANKADITDAIDRLGGGGGSTTICPAIEAATKALKAESRINRRHIIFVTDCQVFDLDEATELAANENYSDITISVVGIGDDGGYFPRIESCTTAWGGVAKQAKGSGNALKNEVMNIMKDDLTDPDISEYIAEEFNPVIADTRSPIVKGIEHGGEGNKAWALNVELGGYFGVRAKSDANVVLTGPYDVPLYAQWQFGAGRVGSFMCDLYGGWSADFLADQNSRNLLMNAMSNLMPTTDISNTEVKASIIEENYINTLYVACDLAEGETLAGRIEYSDGEETRSVSLTETGAANDICYVKTALNNENKRAVFVIKKTGTYRIVIEKMTADGKVAASDELYKSFAFSKEYDITNEGDPDLLKKLAQQGGGEIIEIDDPLKALDNFVANTHHVYDPRLVFVILAMILFILDIWVRKFKFKWLHEIIRDRRERRGGKNEKI